MKSEFEIMALLERYEKVDEGMSINDLANVYRIDAARSLDGCQHLQELEQLAQKMADDNAKSDAKERAQQANARVNEKKLFRHDFKVAAFTVILTLGLEHIADIVNFFKRTLEAIRLFFIK